MTIYSEILTSSSEVVVTRKTALAKLFPLIICSTVVSNVKYVDKYIRYLCICLLSLLKGNRIINVPLTYICNTTISIINLLNKLIVSVSSSSCILVFSMAYRVIITAISTTLCSILLPLIPIIYGIASSINTLLVKVIWSSIGNLTIESPVITTFDLGKVFNKTFLIVSRSFSVIRVQFIKTINVVCESVITMLKNLYKVFTLNEAVSISVIRTFTKTFEVVSNVVLSIIKFVYKTINRPINIVLKFTKLGVKILIVNITSSNIFAKYYKFRLIYVSTIATFFNKILGKNLTLSSQINAILIKSYQLSKRLIVESELLAALDKRAYKVLFYPVTSTIWLFKKWGWFSGKPY